MEKNKHTLSKPERISNQKEVERLFAEGNAFLAFPIRVVYVQQKQEHATASGISILVNVPKRRFKKAVDRNRLKRLIKEAYRLNKADLSDFIAANGVQLQIAFLYIHQEKLTFVEIEKGMKKALAILKEKVS